MTDDYRSSGYMLFDTPGIGHNGPPKDSGKLWNAHCWRKSHKKMWKSPPIETVRRRTRNATKLGLSYREYTSVILDRGHHLQSAFFGLGETLVDGGGDRVRLASDGRLVPLVQSVEKLAKLDCPIFVIANENVAVDAEITHEMMHQVNAAFGGVITDYRVAAEFTEANRNTPNPGTAMIRDLLISHNLVASQSFLVGDTQNYRECAGEAGLARFIWAGSYFR